MIVSGGISPLPLCNGAGICIIFQKSRSLEMLLQDLHNGDIVPTWKIWRRHNHAQFGAERSAARNTQSHYLFCKYGLSCLQQLLQGGFKSVVSKRTFFKMLPALSPKTTAHFVPPISKPRNFSISRSSNRTNHTTYFQLFQYIKNKVLFLLVFRIYHSLRSFYIYYRQRSHCSPLDYAKMYFLRICTFSYIYHYFYPVFLLFRNFFYGT